MTIDRQIGVSTTGHAVAQYSYASVCIFCKSTNVRSQDAKKEAVQIGKKVYDLLRAYEIPDNAIKSSFKLKEKERYGERERDAKQYSAVQHITVFIHDLSHLASILDTLTNIEGAEVETPKLHLSPETKEKMQETALERAWEKAQRRLKHECTVLGLNPDDWINSSHRTDYRLTYREDVNGGEIWSSDEALEFHAGAALVSVNLDLWFRHKDYKPEK